MLTQINTARTLTTFIADLASCNFLFRYHSTSDDAAAEIRALAQEQKEETFHLHGLNQAIHRMEQKLS